MKVSRTEAVLYLAAVLTFLVAHVLFDSPFWLLYVFVGVAFVASLVAERLPGARQKNSPGPAVSPYKVTFNSQKITTYFNDRERESVPWNDLVMVGIRIENEGLVDVPYWILGGRSEGCIYPSDAVGNEALLNEMQTRLSGFDNGAVIEAMGMSSGGRKIWQWREGK